MNDDYSQAQALATEFHRERSTRRTASVLEAKRKRIREDLQYLIAHLNFVSPPSGWHGGDLEDGNRELLVAALGRLEDDAFSQLVLQAFDTSEA